MREAIKTGIATAIVIAGILLMIASIDAIMDLSLIHI